MEHVSGETLQAGLARTPIPPKRAIEIAIEVAEALEEAHKKRVIHEARSRFEACQRDAHRARAREGDGLRLGEASQGWVFG